MGENNSGTAIAGNGNGDSVRLGYAAAGLNAAAALGKLKLNTGDITTFNSGVSYDFGMATVMAMYDRDRVANAATGRGWLLGMDVAVGVGQIRASYSTYRTDAVTSPRSSKFAAGYVHHLSKRTAFYATAARIKNSGTATMALNGSTTAAGGNSTGFDFGISHRF